MTLTGLIGQICMFPLRVIIDACVALRIHPNILTFVGVLINIANQGLFDTPLMFVALAVLAIIGLAFYGAVVIVERRLVTQ